MFKHDGGKKERRHSSQMSPDVVCFIVCRFRFNVYLTLFYLRIVQTSRKGPRSQYRETDIDIDMGIHIHTDTVEDSEQNTQTEVIDVVAGHCPHTKTDLFFFVV